MFKSKFNYSFFTLAVFTALAINTIFANSYADEFELQPEADLSPEKIQYYLDSGFVFRSASVKKIWQSEKENYVAYIKYKIPCSSFLNRIVTKADERDKTVMVVKVQLLAQSPSWCEAEPRTAYSKIHFLPDARSIKFDLYYQ